MTITTLNWRDTLRAIRVNRMVANPNYGFKRQLQDFYNKNLEDVSNCLFVCRVCLHLFVCLIVCLSVCLCVCLYVYLFVCASVCLFFCVFVFLLVLFVFVSVCLIVCFGCVHIVVLNNIIYSFSYLMPQRSVTLTHAALSRKL